MSKISPEDHRPKASIADAYILFFVSLLLVVTIGTVVQAISLPVGLSLTEILLILLPAVAYVRLKRLGVSNSLRWNSMSLGIALRSMILGVSGWGMAMVVYLATVPVVEELLGSDPSSGWFIEAIPETIAQLGVFLIVMAVLPGLCEETLFRGAIQGTFEKRGVWKGVIYAAILFAVYHLNPWNFIPAIALGVLFGVVTVRTNSILPAMVCHVSNNCTAVIMTFIYRGDENKAYLLLGALTVLFALAMWEFFYHTRHATWQPSPLAIAPAHLSRRLKKIAKYAATLLVVLMITAFVGFRAFFHGYRMVSDELSPEIDRGERVLVLKCRYIDVDIQLGDVIAFKRDGHTLLRRVVQTEGDSFWIVEKSAGGEDSEIEVQRGEVIGKVVYSLKIGD